MSIDPDVNAMQEIILDILARLEALEEGIVVEVEEKNGILEYHVPSE